MPTRTSLPCIPPPVDYHTYARGTEPADEQELELIHLLELFYDQQYPRPLMCQVLQTLNLAVEFLSVPELGRQDWPWLSDDNLDLLETSMRSKMALGPLTNELLEIGSLLMEAQPHYGELRARAA